MPNNKNSRKRNGKGASGVKQGQLDDGQGPVANRQSKHQPKKGKATSPATPALSDNTPSCSWSAFKACSPLLAAPLSCSTIGCTAAEQTKIISQKILAHCLPSASSCHVQYSTIGQDSVVNNDAVVHCCSSGSSGIIIKSHNGWFRSYCSVGRNRTIIFRGSVRW